MAKDDKITTPGSILIKHMMPTAEAKQNYDIYQKLDKSGMTTLVNTLVKHGGDKGFDTVNDLAKMFFNKATEIGTSTPLSDYENDSDERQAYISEFEQKVKQILSKKMDPKKKTAMLDSLAAQTRGKINTQNLNYLLSRGSVAAKMAASGARGNPSQLGIGTATPLMGFDVRGFPIPVVIKHSFAEGLSPAETIAMSYGGRASTVLTQLTTEKPGDLFKKLTPSMFHEMVTEQDCKTTNGIMIPGSDAQAIIGRFEAGTNHFIDEHYYNTLKHRQNVKVRSVLTCEAHEGVCQRCYGLAANGKLSTIGENVGLIGAQSISQVLTQAMLSTKHQGGVSGQRTAYDEVNNLLSNPKENFQDESAISTVNGKVTKINKTALNDWEVYVNTHPHFVSREQTPTVKVGERVKVGDPLSTGTLNPRKLTELKGPGAGRIYLANKLREVYNQSESGIDPRHFELVAKNMIRFVQVQDPGESGFLPGQEISIGELTKHLREHLKRVPLAGAAGETLATSILELTPGTLLTGNHIEELKKAGIDHVNITTDNLKVIPIVPGLRSVKLLDKNWISNLSFSHLKKTLQEAPVTGAKSPVHGIDPIAPYVIGTDFGEGNRGKY